MKTTTLSGSGTFTVDAALEVVDMTGRVTMQRTLSASSHRNSFSVTRRAQGLYAVRVQQGHTVHTGRFLKQWAMPIIRSLLTVLFVEMLAYSTAAQAPDILWQRCLGGSSMEVAWGLVALEDGGCAAFGWTTSNDGDVTDHGGSYDFWLVRLDAQGELLWQRTYGGTGSDNTISSRMLGTEDGGFLLLGRTNSLDGDVICNDSFSTGAWVLKVDSLGELQWQLCLDGGSSLDMFTDAVQRPDGGYIVVGSTKSDTGLWLENHGQIDYFAVGIDVDGEVEWLRCYGGSGNDPVRRIVATSDGQYVVSGLTDSSDGQVTTGEHGRIWVIKIDGQGNLLWNRRMGGLGGLGVIHQAYGLTAGPDGSVVVGAYTNAEDGDASGNCGGTTDVWLVLLDSDGSILDQQCFGGSGIDSAWDVIRTPNGYLVAASSNSTDGDVTGNHGATDAWLLLVDDALELQWQRSYGGSGVDIPNVVTLTPSGHVYFAGATSSNDGDMSGNHGETDLWVVKLAQTSNGVEEAAAGTPLSVYPSPATEQVQVALPVGFSVDATLEVVDMTGRVVLQRTLSATSLRTNFSVAGWAQGLYAVRVQQGSTVHTGRFVKQ